MPSLRSLTVGLLALCLAPTGVFSSVFQRPLSSPIQCKHDVKIVDFKPKDLIVRFDNLTAQLTELAGPTKDLTANNAFLVVANEGPFPIILERVVAFVNGAEEFLGEIDVEKPLKKGKDSDDVLEAYKAATKAGVFWANLMSSKANSFKGPAFANSGFFKPVGALGESALRGVLEIFEAFAFAVTDYLDDRVGDVQEHSSSLSRTFDAVILDYGLIKAGRA